jgi:hypothetical protein
MTLTEGLVGTGYSMAYLALLAAAAIPGSLAWIRVRFVDPYPKH